jgi:thiol-disulfide isomerase/thioredoxin
MNEKELQIEVHLEVKSIPRDTITRMIWLHPTQAAATDSPSVVEQTGIRAQAIPSDGNRLTFFAEKFSGSTFSGRNLLLGTCHVDVKNVDRLLFGAAIEEAASALVFHNWKLSPAPDPIAPSEGGDRDSEGLESALVGKPAPDFELDLLDGKKFQLAAHMKKILVLDFWASWCGPCLQVMPQVEKVANEFAKEDVELLAINLQESSDDIRRTLGRLKLNMSVALDRDGLVAEKYGATSIPQTVIIDRDGKVVRLFVGGSARFEEQLRATLRAVIDAKGS